MMAANTMGVAMPAPAPAPIERNTAVPGGCNALLPPGTAVFLGISDGAHKTFDETYRI